MTKSKKTIVKNSETYKNLQTAFQGESAARVRYQIFASKAKKDGYVHLSDIFTKSSDNEKEHAEIWLKYLCANNEIEDTVSNILTSISNEKEEWSNMYVKFANTAKKEGYDELSSLFNKVAEIEKFHETRYKELLSQIKTKTMFVSKSSNTIWHCLNCGSNIKSKNAPTVCPVCSHPQAYFVNSETKIIK